ncbi:hypothetical protein BASA61_008660 [Batrachochytrium salamandrivorans]|nr:hypothetical protein BASA61_008660 [Batrachochytrium salamandrivorans]
MKLISFAVISLLAITVIAQPPQSTTTQSEQPPHSTTTQSEQPPQSTFTQSKQSLQSTFIQSEQQPDQDKVQAEAVRLDNIKDDYHVIIEQLTADIIAVQQKAVIAGKMSDTIKIRLQNTGLSSEERLELEKQDSDVEATLDTLYIECGEHNSYQTDIDKNLGILSAELYLLEDNQKLIAKHNVEHVVQLTPSPNSFFNLDILKDQYNNYLNDIKILLGQEDRLRKLGPLLIVIELQTLQQRVKGSMPVSQRYAGVAKRILERAGIRVVD